MVKLKESPRATYKSTSVGEKPRIQFFFFFKVCKQTHLTLVPIHMQTATTIKGLKLRCGDWPIFLLQVFSCACTFQNLTILLISTQRGPISKRDYNAFRALLFKFAHIQYNTLESILSFSVDNGSFVSVWETNAKKQSLKNFLISAQCLETFDCDATFTSCLRGDEIFDDQVGS